MRWISLPCVIPAPTALTPAGIRIFALGDVGHTFLGGLGRDARRLHNSSPARDQ